jgi:hypothetical protein
MKSSHLRTATIVAAGAVAALSAAPAMAAPAKGPVHQTPRVPVVIDGVRYAPQAIHRYDGREVHLKLRRAPSGRPELVVSTKAPKLPRRGRARASSPGGHVRYWVDASGRGLSTYRHAGQAITDLAGEWVWCPGFYVCFGFDNSLSSVETNGGNTVLFDGTFFSGSSLSIPGEWDRIKDLSAVGFNDMASSLFVR